jgi:hypothetical protein
MRTTYQGAAAVIGLAAAALSGWVALIEVPDNLDTFIGAFNRIGQVSQWAAAASAAAALFQVLALFARR